MESGDTVARFELGDIRTNFLNYTTNVVALVYGDITPIRYLPILRIGPAHDDLNKDFVGSGLWDRRVDDLDLRA